MFFMLNFDVKPPASKTFLLKCEKMKALKHRVPNVPWDPENPNKIRRKSSLTQEKQEEQKEKMEVEPSKLDDMKVQVEEDPSLHGNLNLMKINLKKGMKRL